MLITLWSIINLLIYIEFYSHFNKFIKFEFINVNVFFSQIEHKLLNNTFIIRSASSMKMFKTILIVNYEKICNLNIK